MPIYRYLVALIVDQVDDNTFQARFLDSGVIVTASLAYELWIRQNIQPLVGDLVKLLEYNGFRGTKYTIVKVLVTKKYEDNFRKIATPITTGLATLRRFNHTYASFTIVSFFGSKLSQLLYSNLDLKTVEDLVFVNNINLSAIVFDFSELDREEFHEIFANLVEFFEGY